MGLCFQFGVDLPQRGGFGGQSELGLVVCGVLALGRGEAPFEVGCVYGGCGGGADDNFLWAS